jgi:hypothetical protein
MQRMAQILAIFAGTVSTLALVAPALAQVPTAPYQRYITHHGEVVATAQAPVAAMPAYRPTSASYSPSAIYQPTAVRVQTAPQPVSRYQAPRAVMAAPQQAHAPQYYAPAARMQAPQPQMATANDFARMAPAAGRAPLAGQPTVNREGNRFIYGDVRQVIPGAKERMDRNQAPIGADTYLTMGYRTGELNWNISGLPDGTGPNVLSELTWDSLQMMEIGAGTRYTVPHGTLKNMRLEGQFYYAYAVSGDNQDSDYEFDNRQNEFSRSNNSADGSAAWGAKLAAGYEIPFAENPKGLQFTATPLIGYQGHKQKLRMDDGNQTVCENAPSLGYTCGLPLGPFAGLKSRYEASWSGPFVAAEAKLGYTDAHMFRLRGEYGIVNFDGEGRWNMRPDFAQDPSFKHDADGNAFSIGGEYRYLWTPTLGVVFSGEWQSFKADGGTDRTFLANNTGTVETRLNEVEWTSQAYRVGVEKKF